MQKVYYQCNKCNSEMQESYCSKCKCNDVVMIIFNGTNKIPVRYVEEERKIEPIGKKNVWSELDCLIKK